MIGWEFETELGLILYLLFVKQVQNLIQIKKFLQKEFQKNKSINV
jgi:hypothetical protein